MMRLGKKLRNLQSAVRILTLIGILIFSLISCKSPTSRDGEGEADIIIYNEYGGALDIYMDGNFQFTIGHRSDIDIDSVSLGKHKLEAKKVNTNIVIASEIVEVKEKIDYIWRIDDPPDINVTNLYGNSLKIYMDGNYQFDLVDEENSWIIDVPYGERFLKALKTSGGKLVASTAIDIIEDKDYSWTIK